MANWIIAPRPLGRRYQDRGPAFAAGRVGDDPPAFDKEVPVPRLSIVIPCLGGAAEFDGTLVAVLQHRPAADCEVLVAHTAEYSDPYRLAGEVRFLHLAAAGSLCQLLNEAIEAAASDIIHVLACGLEPTEGWTDPALAHFRDEDIAAVVPALMNADGSRLVAAGVRMSAGGRRRVLSDRRLLLPGSGHLRTVIAGPTLAAGFYRRQVLQALGGFDVTATDRLADVSLALDLAALELRSDLEPSSRIFQVYDPFLNLPDQPLARGRAAERLFWRNAAAVGMPLALAAHPFVVAGSLLADLPGVGGLLGRALALCEVGSVRRNTSRLMAAADRLEANAACRATVPLRRQLIAAPTREPERQRRAA